MEIELYNDIIRTLKKEQELYQAVKKGVKSYFFN